MFCFITNYMTYKYIIYLQQVSQVHSGGFRWEPVLQCLSPQLHLFVLYQRSHSTKGPIKVNNGMLILINKISKQSMEKNSSFTDIIHTVIVLPAFRIRASDKLRLRDGLNSSSKSEDILPSAKIWMLLKENTLSGRPMECPCSKDKTITTI